VTDVDLETIGITFFYKSQYNTNNFIFRIRKWDCSYNTQMHILQII